MKRIRSELTAIRRREPSLSVRLALELGLVSDPVLDYGCGVGRDFRFLRSRGYDAQGWDPFYFPPRSSSVFRDTSFQCIMCTYVLNVVSKHTRSIIVGDVRRLLAETGNAIFTVRSTSEIARNAKLHKWKRYRDGWLTWRHTFQKGFSDIELQLFLRKNGFSHVDVVRRNPVVECAYA